MGLALATTAVSAQSVLSSNPTQTKTYTVTSTIQNLASLDSFSVPCFDSSLGTLANVGVSIQTGPGQSFQIFSTSNPTANFTNSGFSISSKLGNGNTAFTTFVTGGSTGAPTSHKLGSTTQTGTITNPNTGITQPDFASDLALWQNQSGGLVSLNWGAGLPTYPTSTFGHGLFSGSHASNNGTFTVSYTYVANSVAAPEPSGKALTAIAALAAAAIVFARRRKLVNA